MPPPTTLLLPQVCALRLRYIYPLLVCWEFPPHLYRGKGTFAGIDCGGFLGDFGLVDLG